MSQGKPGREGSRCLTRQEQVASYSRALVVITTTATTLRAAVLLRRMRVLKFSTLDQCPSMCMCLDPQVHNITTVTHNTRRCRIYIADKICTIKNFMLTRNASWDGAWAGKSDAFHLRVDELSLILCCDRYFIYRIILHFGSFGQPTLDGVLMHGVAVVRNHICKQPSPYCAIPA